MNKIEYEWEWLPHKQHFCLGHRCNFSLATRISPNLIVSTIGELRYLDESKHGWEEVGCGRLYETQLLLASEKLHEEGCGCPDGIIEYELDFGGCNTAREAISIHMDMCRKYSGVIWEKE